MVNLRLAVPGVQIEVAAQFAADPAGELDEVERVQAEIVYDRLIACDRGPLQRGLDLLDEIDDSIEGAVGVLGQDGLR